MNNILELKNVTKKYPGVIALKNASLAIREGEVHALVGENGAGKSTLIKTITGAIQPEEGTIIYQGKEYSGLNPILSGQIGIEAIYQEFNLAPDLTVEILSEATKSKDLLIKTYKYKHAGVKEYWIIDPERLEILVYDFEGNHLDKYSFDDQVPIRISKGRCKIDFTHIRRNLGL